MRSSLIVLVTFSLALTAAADPSIQYEVLALSGTQAPGTPDGVLFRRLGDPPAIGDDGSVVFEADLVGIDVDGENNVGIWVRHPGEPVALLARAQDPVPGRVDAWFGGMTQPFVNGTGEVVFRGPLLGAGVEDPGAWGVIRRDAAGIYRRDIYGGGQPPLTAPGTEFLLPPRGPFLNEAGQLGLLSALRENGIYPEGRGLALWLAEPGSPPSLIVREGDRAPALPAGTTLGAFGDYGHNHVGFNNLGEFAFSGAFQTETTTRNAVWAPNEAGLLAPRVVDGQAAPGATGATFRDFDSFVLMNDDRRVVVWAEFQAGGSASDGIWLIEPDGEIVPIAVPGRSFHWGDSSSGHLSSVVVTRSAANQGALNEAGEVLFYAGVSTLGAGVFSWDSNTRSIDLVFAGRNPPDLPPNVGFSVESFALAQDGTALVSGPLSGGGFVPASQRAIYLVPSAGTPILVARAGLTLEVDGEPRTIRYMLVDAERGPGRRPVNANGEVVFQVSFEDNTTAIIHARVDLDGDVDDDGIPDPSDNCPDVANPDQADTDDDFVGDACNDAEDLDGDEWSDAIDNCPGEPNPEQRDTDRDGEGDACNHAVDPDRDGYRDDLDNCPDVPNDQSERDGDGLGDACDPFPDEPDNEKGQLGLDLSICSEELAVCSERRFFEDEDRDGEEDSTDECPGTPEAEAVDQAGCSRAQFCERLPSQGSKLECRRADWQNDEPGSQHPQDCRLDWRGAWLSLAEPACVPAGQDDWRSRWPWSWK